MSRFKKMPIGDLIVDERYQRPLDDRRVAKMAADFNDALFGTLEVSQSNGRSAVFDGQHRLEAARAAGRDIVPCLVHSGLTPEQEADLFVELQRRRKGIQPVDHFKARVFSGDPKAVAITKILSRHGYRVAQNSGTVAGQQKAIAAVGALDRVFTLGVLDETMELLADVWGGDHKSTEGWIIEGLAIVVHGYGHRIGAEEREKLREIAPVTLIRRAVAKIQTFGAHPERRGIAVAAEIRKSLALSGAPKKRKPKP